MAVKTLSQNLKRRCPAAAAASAAANNGTHRDPISGGALLNTESFENAFVNHMASTAA